MFYEEGNTIKELPRMSVSTGAGNDSAALAGHRGQLVKPFRTASLSSLSSPPQQRPPPGS